MNERQRDLFLYVWSRRRTPGQNAIALRGALIGAAGGLLFTLLMFGGGAVSVGNTWPSLMHALSEGFRMLVLAVPAFGAIGYFGANRVYASQEAMYQAMLQSGAQVPAQKPVMQGADRWPAIAVGIGAHVNLFFPELPPNYVAVGAYLLFTLLNVIGVKLAATFEFFITFVAVAGLILFAGITFSDVSLKNLTHNALPNGWAGAWAAIPFAIWFFLGIEGLANAAEESQNPQRDLTWGFGSAMLTLVMSCAMTFVGAVGVGGWEAAVFKVDGTTSDSPLPLALAQLVGESAPLYFAVIVAGLFGLVASFHGLLMAAGRATFEMGRAGHFPK